MSDILNAGLILFWFCAKAYLTAALIILFAWCWDMRREMRWNPVKLIVRIILALGWLPLMIRVWQDGDDYPFKWQDSS